MFDKAYCVNLKHRTDRWEHFQKEVEFLNIDVERFEAIDGKTYGIKPGTPPHPTWSIISLGNLGNVISQRRIFKNAIKQNYNSILIFEDDVEFDKNINLERDYFQHIPKNWDMIYFGGNHVKPLIPVNEYVGRCLFTLTAHAIIFKDTTYYKIMSLTSGLGAPIDLYYSMLHEDFNVYAPLKPIAWQMSGYSDIADKEVDYTCLK